MKTVLYLLVILSLLFSSLHIASALTSQQAALAEGQSVEIAGKTILVDTVSYDFVIVLVDGVKKVIEAFEAEDENGFVVYKSNINYVNGVNISIADIIGRESAILNIAVGFDCGDGICEESESKTICCTDCNCSSSGYVCLDNQCIESISNECFNDSDCDDSNLCSLDACTSLPRKCSHAVIDYCKDYDDCCPEACMYENDTDCPREKTTYECFTWHDCKQEGQSSCNQSSCETGKCVYEIQEGCDFNSTCLTINSALLVNGTNFTCNQDGLISSQGKKLAAGEQGSEEGFKAYLWLFILFILLVVAIIFLAWKFFIRKKSL